LLVLLWSAGSALATPFLSPDYGTQVTTNLVYGTGAINGGAGTMNLTLDLYEPTDIGTPVPATSPGIVLIHGGGFFQGDKADLGYLATIYASYGYRVASINYRLGPDDPPLEPGPSQTLQAPPPGYATVPVPAGYAWINAAFQDSMKAMTWMTTNGGAYGIDTARVALGGYSAGAITSLLEAYNEPPASAMPTVMMSFMGNMYGTEGVIDGDDPPAFIVHGTNDASQYYPSAVAMANQMTAVGVYNEFNTIVGGTHALNINTFNLVMPNGNTILENNMLFLANYLVPEPSGLVLAACGALAMAILVLRARS
jgi:acetyl esterase/lipase